jgi:hypothetical protein
MPPLDWSIVQSALLFLILPCLGITVLITAISVATTSCVNYRNLGAAIAVLAGITLGNCLNKLVPFGGLETGWRSLYWATCAAVIAELLISRYLSKGPRIRASKVASIALTAFLAAWLMDWDPKDLKLWLCGLLFLAILLNWDALTLLSQTETGRFLPLSVGVVWGGSTTALLVLSHSARFADLSILMSCCLVGVGLVSAISGQRLRDIYAGPATFFPSLLLAAALNTYSNIPQLCFVVVGISPVFWEALRWKKISNWLDAHPKTFLLISLLPGLIAVGLAARAEL